MEKRKGARKLTRQTKKRKFVENRKKAERERLKRNGIEKESKKVTRQTMKRKFIEKRKKAEREGEKRKGKGKEKRERAEIKKLMRRQ